MTALIAI